MAPPLLALSLAGPVRSQSVACAPVQRILSEEMGLPAEVTVPDSVRDWTTGDMVRGCSVTAAGATTDWQASSDSFFARFEARGWTQDIHYASDGPNGTGRGYALGGILCLVGTSVDFTLGTEAERRVDALVRPGPDERLYHVHVACFARSSVAAPKLPSPRGGPDLTAPEPPGHRD